jgi:ATP-dependent Clp protease ATP-binding subunit ClpB
MSRIAVAVPNFALSRISFRLRHSPVVLALPGRVRPYTSSRQLPVIPGYVRSYASQPPGGGGGGSGGFPGFMLPGQQQHQKGDALKEYVSQLSYVFLSVSVQMETSEC